ncbi:SufE family protein [Cyclobacterium marinum]|uniref:Fe-S metabolism associated SufE n=1 Tax=Cyclobacterium marinum (strain ATCC 25205 / DSM 745 / LMG 13164 / NCIMB 1802) TaxID=880070 RepID=G0J4G5_CYCMS|nr:SufE family protein [Cyclobacterium marinum]AEL28405.1 Fe-S metabolism associated SufE [Cyclobacterium marinum DSM 745]MBI0398256.1 SufE family protein [Cyclobacterium marinum]|tara:strand:- start:23992 stop:24423 length:432 start_codon:yes stop_codon:yes gene_type:complete
MAEINSIQEEIIGEFEILGDDKESTIYYIMELGDQLPEFPEKDKVEDNIIKGCQSKVWLTSSLEEGKVHFQADSNTDITKGLISLLIRVLSGQPANEIINADLYFIEKIGMGNIIGSQRSNGLTAMIKQMKLFAIAYKAKINA